MASLFRNLLKAPSMTPCKNRCASMLNAYAFTGGDTHSSVSCTSFPQTVPPPHVLYQPPPPHSYLLNASTCNSPNFVAPRRFIFKNVQVAPNKYAKMKQEAPAGSLISMDGNVTSLEELEDSEEGQISRKAKTVIEYPVLTSHFPFENDMDTLYYSGVHYHDLPVIFAIARWNNLLVTLYDQDGNKLMYTSCRKEGYRNAKKKSPVANQQVGQNVARRTLKLGFNCVKLVLRGVGPGREPFVRGLYLGGMNIASLTDATAVHDYYDMKRPKKQRKV